jgi:Na+-translocating ferredoxin:NAD+ oxidoreductase RNF subunit RnfB
MAPEKLQWKELFSEVVTSGLCTGCAACVIACPHPVLDYNADGGVYKPFHLDIDGGPDDCTHGQKGCTMCTRACPRFRNWESEIDVHAPTTRSTALVTSCWCVRPTNHSSRTVKTVDSCRRC